MDHAMLLVHNLLPLVLEELTITFMLEVYLIRRDKSFQRILRYGENLFALSDQRMRLQIPFASTPAPLNLPQPSPSLFPSERTSPLPLSIFLEGRRFRLA